MSGRDIHSVKLPPQFKPPDINPRTLGMVLLGLIVALGRYTGFRLTELVRFRQLAAQEKP